MRQKVMRQKVMSKPMISSLVLGNKGFTFIEIMIALMIGLGLTLMTLTIFVNNKRAYDVNNRMIEMNRKYSFCINQHR